MATKVSIRPRPRTPKAEARRAPMFTSDLSPPGWRGRNSTENACSIATLSPRMEATAKRASEPSHSRARSWDIFLRGQGSGIRDQILEKRSHSNAEPESPTLKLLIIACHRRPVSPGRIRGRDCLYLSRITPGKAECYHQL